jgi:uncharacterized coiled-coil protein SlyX
MTGQNGDNMAQTRDLSDVQTTPDKPRREALRALASAALRAAAGFTLDAREVLGLLDAADASLEGGGPWAALALREIGVALTNLRARLVLELPRDGGGVVDQRGMLATLDALRGSVDGVAREIGAHPGVPPAPHLLRLYDRTPEGTDVRTWLCPCGGRYAWPAADVLDAKAGQWALDHLGHLIEFPGARWLPAAVSRLVHDLARSDGCTDDDARIVLRELAERARRLRETPDARDTRKVMPSVCPVCGRRMCDHTPAERGQTEAQMMEPVPADGVVELGAPVGHLCAPSGTLVLDADGKLAGVLDREIRAAQRRLTFSIGEDAGRGQSGVEGANAYLGGVAERLTVLGQVLATGGGPTVPSLRDVAKQAHRMLESGRMVLAAANVPAPCPNHASADDLDAALEGQRVARAERDEARAKIKAMAARIDGLESEVRGRDQALRDENDEVLRGRDELAKVQVARDLLVERTKALEGALASIRLVLESWGSSAKGLPGRAVRRAIEHASFALFGASAAGTDFTWREERDKLALPWLESATGKLAETEACR